MGGHRGFIVHFDWMELQEVVGVGGEGGWTRQITVERHWFCGRFKESM